MKFYFQILFVSLLPIFVIAFFFGFGWNSFLVNTALAGAGQDLGYIQVNSDTEVYDFDSGTAYYLDFYNNSDATTSIDSIRLRVAGNCTNTGTYPRLELTGPVTAYSAVTDILGDTEQYIEFNFASSIEIPPSVNAYAIRLTVSACTQKPRIFGIDTNPYGVGNGEIYNRAGAVEQTGLQYFMIDPNDYSYDPDTTDAYVDPTILSWRSDINTVQHQTCFTGEECRLWFSFNDKALGNTVYLTPDVQGQQNPDYSIDSTLITFSGISQNYFNLDIEYDPATTTNCLYMTDAEYGDLLLCGIQTTWMSSTTFYEMLEATLDYDHLCDDIATSSPTYEIECGIKKLFWHLFGDIDPKSITYLMNGVDKFKSSFPMNTFFSLTDIAQRTMASTTLSNDSTLGIPLINTSGEYYIAPVLSSSSMTDLIGSENSSLFRKFQDWMIWLAVIALIVFIVMSKHL